MNKLVYGPVREVDLILSKLHGCSEIEETKWLKMFNLIYDRYEARAFMVHSDE